MKKTKRQFFKEIEKMLKDVPITLRSKIPSHRIYIFTEREMEMKQGVEFDFLNIRLNKKGEVIHDTRKSKRDRRKV